LFDVLKIQVVFWLSNTDKVGEKEAMALQYLFNNKNPNGFQIHTFRNITENMPVYEQLGIHRSKIYIIRPDNYIGYIGEVDVLEGVLRYLFRFS